MARDPGGQVNFGDPSYFERVDETDDALFYQMPRLVIHVDDHASQVLAARAARSGDPERIAVESVTIDDAP